jgi:two-component system sporulation sensor kinase B
VLDVIRGDFSIFLLNLSFVFFLFFIYYKHIERRYTCYSSPVLITVVASISIILCMIFSINPIKGFIFDMRHVPFIIGALYGGRKVGFTLLVVLLSYRFYIGGMGFWFATFEFIVIYSTLWYYTPIFHEFTKTQQKVKLAAIVSSITPIIFILVYVIFNLNLSTSEFIFLVILHTIPLLGVIFFVIFIENARKENLLLKELIEIEKVKIISDIAASISHEVRNPLTVTSGFLQLLKDKGISDDKRVKYIELSLNELKRAENVINDYLTFAKPTLENILTLSVKDEIEYVINVVSPYAMMYNVKIKVDQLTNVLIAGERQKLHQSLINILKNGIEAMPNGGELTIDLLENEEHAVITIIDCGMGMNDEQLERLGTPYYTSKGAKGTGLGTMVVYSIVKAMRGQIKVDSVVGRGTSFTIHLPKVTRGPFLD